MVEKQMVWILVLIFSIRAVNPTVANNYRILKEILKLIQNFNQRNLNCETPNGPGPNSTNKSKIQNNFNF